MSLFKCSSLLSPWVMCQSFSLCKGMAAAAKVFSNSYSHPKEAKDCFLCMCILEASSGTQAVTSSASGLSISLEPQVFKSVFYMTDQDTSSTKITEFSVMASQMVLWPSISSLSILIHIQPPDWFFYTILLYDFFIPKPPMTFTFHMTPASCFWSFPILSFPTWPLPSSPNLPCVTSPFLCSDWVCPSLFLLLVSIHSVFCTWKTSGVSQSPSRRQDSGTQKPQQMKGLYRGVVSIWGNTAREICHPAICTARGENRPPGRGPAWQEH